MNIHKNSQLNAKNPKAHKASATLNERVETINIMFKLTES